MSLARRYNDRENLIHLIKEWNESRLDIFALSQPNEKLEFFGVMRFFFQDAGAKVATKCVRVNSDQTAEDVTKILVDKFHPDLKMLTMPKYCLYEVHQNGDARKLDKNERPLMVQLKWHEDDREGRFLLKSETNKSTVPKTLFASSDLAPIQNPNFKRKLSKREKKELKKKRQEEKKHGKKDQEAEKDLSKEDEGGAIAQQLYDEIPESGFTRSISNPEAVLRRRRQQKLEKKLKEFEGKDGSPDTGGPLRIYAETLKPEIPYKTLLVSMHAPTTHVVKDALEKYGLEKEDPDEYCLVMVNIPAEGQSRDNTMGKDVVIPDEDCPFAVVSAWPDERGELTLHLRRRTNLPRYRQKKKTPRGSSSSNQPPPSPQMQVDRDKLPYLIQLTPDGRELEYKPKVYYIQPDVTEVGSENSSGSTTHFFPLFAPHILPQHSVIASNDGVVTVTPCSSDAETAVNGARIYETTRLRHGMIVRFGRVHTFRYVDPVKEREIEDERRQRAEETHSASSGTSSTGNISAEGTVKAAPVQYVRKDPTASMNRRSAPAATRSSNSSFLSERKPDDQQQRPGPRTEADHKRHSETTFGVDGAVETFGSPTKRDPTRDQRFSGTYERSQQGREPGRHPPGGDHQRRSAPPVVVAEPMDIDDDEGMDLPARLEYREAGEDAFFAAVISEVNGAAVHFKLAPTYTLYMCARYRISPAYRPEYSREQRAERMGITARKMANMARSTVRENHDSASSLSFWMANASELLYFMKQDRDLSPHTTDAQQILGQSVHHAFKLLVHCIQQELAKFMPSFLDESDESDHDESDLESVLSGEGSRRRSGKPVIGDILYTLSTAMSLLYRCRVNAALTIQIFSQLYHFINMWLFNKIVLHPELELCTQAWGARLKRRLSIVEAWAAKQGMELAADCHLCRINQAAHLLQAPKGCPEDITSISSTCFKLNSLQLRCLLEYYIPSEDEPGIPPELIDNVVAIAENTADELTRSDGQDVQLEEDPDLQLPFLLPEDGYSSDLIRGIPPGLREFLNPLCATGLCRLTVQPMSPGLWTVHFKDFRFTENGGIDKARKVSEGGTVYGLREPEVTYVTLDKGNGGMGLSIVAAKGAGQEHLGIYVKAVVKGGCADRDGRLAPGDQLLSVNGESLVGVSQERAAELMKKTGSTVHLEVAKQGAIYHGLATLLNQSASAKDPSQRLRPMDPAQPQPVSPTLPENELQHQQLRWINEGEHSPKHKRHPRDEEIDRRVSESDDDHWAAMERRREQERRRIEMERQRAEDERKRVEEDKQREENHRMEEERMWREKKQREEEQRRLEHEKQVKQQEQSRIDHERQVTEQRRLEYEKLVEAKRREDEERRRSREIENERNAPRIVVEQHQERSWMGPVSEHSHTIRAHEETNRNPQENNRKVYPGQKVTSQDSDSDNDNEKTEAMVVERVIEQNSRISHSEPPPSPHSPSSPSYRIRFDDEIPGQSPKGSLPRQEPKRERPPSRGKPTYGRVIAVTRESFNQQRSPARGTVTEENVQRKTEEEHRRRTEQEYELEVEKQRQHDLEREYRELLEKQKGEEEEKERKEREDRQREQEEHLQRLKRQRDEEEQIERQRRQQEEERLERERRQQEEEERLERERRQREEERLEMEHRQREEEERLERERRQIEEQRLERERRQQEEEEHLEREHRQREAERIEWERKQREKEEQLERECRQREEEEQREREEEERLERERRKHEEEERVERERRQREEEERHERERRQREEERQERERKQREEEERRERERKQREEEERLEREREEWRLEEDRRRREQERLEFERREWERRQQEEERLARELKEREERKRIEQEEKIRKQREEEEKLERQQKEQEEREKREKERQEREAEEFRIKEERRLAFEREEAERKQREEREMKEQAEKERAERQRLAVEERIRIEEERGEDEKRKRRERLQQLYQEQREKEEDDRRAFELKRQKEQDRREKEQHEQEAEEQERLEEERIMRELEEDEKRKTEERKREQAIELQRREEEQRWMREVEQQRAYLREPMHGVMHGSSSLDRIDQMNPDDVEKEFNRRLEEERQKSQRRSRVYSEDDDDDMTQREQEEKIAREQWRLERLHLEREQQRQVQQRIMEQRQREQEEWLAQQKIKREQQRIEQEQQRNHYKIKEEEEKERKKVELHHKRELEDRLRRESIRQKDLEEHKIREERRQAEMKLEQEKLRKLEEQRIIQDKEEELQRENRGYGYNRTSYDLHPVHQQIVYQALGAQERRIPSDDNFHYGGPRRDPRVGYDQQLRQARSNPQLLNEDFEFSRPMRKHVSFSDVTTEIPHSPTSPKYTQAPSQVTSRHEYDPPPPPPPPPPPEDVGDEEEFPAPPLPPPPQKLPPPPPPKSHVTYEKYEQQMQKRIPQSRESSSYQPREGLPTTTVVSRRQFVSESDYSNYQGDSRQRRSRPLSYPSRPVQVSEYSVQVTFNSNEELYRQEQPAYVDANLRPVPTSPIRRDFNEYDPNQGGLRRLLTDSHKNQAPPPTAPKPEKMSFREKLKVFNPNEYTPPPQKTRASKWQQQQLAQLNGQ